MSTNSQISEQHMAINNNEISFKEIILKIQDWRRYVWSKKVLIIAFGLVGGIMGFIYAYFQKPIYTATTTFVLEGNESGGGLGQYSGLASMVGIDLGGGGGGIFQGDNIIALYTSRNMIERTLLTDVLIDNKRQTLMDRYLAITDAKEGWKDRSDLLALKFESSSTLNNLQSKRLRDSVLGATVSVISKNYLSVSKPDKKLSIIQVDVKSRDEQFSKLFNDEIVATVNNFYLQTKTKKSAENITILQGKVDSVKAVMSGAIYAAASVNDATPNINPTRLVQRLAPQQKAQFSAETNKAILGTLIQNLELAKIAMRKDAPLIQKVDEPLYPLKIEKMSVLKGALIAGMVLVVLVVFYLTCLRAYKSLMAY